MFFTGDATSRKRVDLGGRSSKERDREKVLEQNRLERKRRQEFRQRNLAATKIQKCFRGRKDFDMARHHVQQQFYKTYGDRCQKADWHCFGPNSEFLPQLLFFFTGKNHGDVILLVEACRLLLQYVRDGGNIVGLLSGNDYSSYSSLVDVRVKKLAHLCLLAVYENRSLLKDQLLIYSTSVTVPANLLLEMVVCLANSELPWVGKVVDYLLQRKVFSMLRSIILSGLHNMKSSKPHPGVSSLELVLVVIASHNVHFCSSVDPRWSFSSQILSIPFVWHHFPILKEAFWTKGLGKHYIHQMALDLPGNINVLPEDIQQESPGYACLLGNLLEAAGAIFSESNCPSYMAIDFLNVSTFLMEAVPTEDKSARENSLDDELAMDEDYKEALSPDIHKQISSSIDRSLLNNVVNTLFRDFSQTAGSIASPPSSEEVEAVDAVCAFLHVTFITVPHELFMTLLAYRTELVPVLWNYIQRCHENQIWPSYSKLTTDLPGGVPGWLLPLAVFCPVYRHMLKFVDTEEFYEQEKPLNLRDIRCLVIIIKQALWQLLWIIPGEIPSFKKMSRSNEDKKLTLEIIKNRARIAMSELLSQLQDWNNRRQFTSAEDFHLQEATNETFVSQALAGGSRASEILKQAPFLVPFTSRVKIFASELAAPRPIHGSRFKIRRDRILEDAFNQLSALSEEDLRGSIRVAFVNEFGVEEVGIDGGGIFKDFMENIVQAAFDVQYGLFKETTDHFLYPNPGSALVHEQHLQFFHFLGSLLGKAMYEGILVDIPFATFFLSKLKAKSNFLHDLPSLDPELYRHLMFLKHYKGDVSELELYFVVVNNEYGEQIEEELLPGGKDMRVTKENVIQFIHLVANYRLNYQIRNQSLHFLRGFQQLIKKEWIEMFNEREIQLLISGSLESIDIDDLRLNTRYTGGYHSDHHVIQLFWEVLKNFSMEYQKKFLKFVTGCSRGPLLGFKHLEPNFCIQRVGDLNLDRLPTAATCMNLLKLPPYESIEQMREKLLYAISAEAGFDLS